MNPEARDVCRDRKESGAFAACLIAVGLCIVILCAVLLPSEAIAEVETQANEEVLYQVVFKVGGSTYATNKRCDASSTINRAFELTGVDRPTGAEGSQFKGWSTSPTAVEPDRGYTTTVREEYAKTGASERLELYAVFGNSVRPHVTFFQQDGTTLIAEGTIDAWQTLNDVKERPDARVTDGSGNLLLRVYGEHFIGWADENGRQIYFDEPLVNDVQLRPLYRNLAVSISGTKKAAVDVSKAFLLQSGVESATNAGFFLEKATKTNSALKTAATAKGRTISDYYRSAFRYTLDGQNVALNKGFGMVAISLPVSAANGTKVKVYWTASDGTIASSAEKKVSNGVVLLNFADYKVGSGANLVVSYKASSSSASSSNSGSASSSSASSSSASSSSNSSSSASSSGGSSSSNGSSSTGSSSSSYSSPARYSSSNDGSDDESDEEGAGDDGDDENDKSDEPTDEEFYDGEYDGLLDDDASTQDYLGLDEVPDADEATGGTSNSNTIALAVLLLLAVLSGLAWWLVNKHGAKGGLFDPEFDSGQDSGSDGESCPGQAGESST